jgi:hypothetical protein
MGASPPPLRSKILSFSLLCFHSLLLCFFIPRPSKYSHNTHSASRRKVLIRNKKKKEEEEETEEEVKEEEEETEEK